MAGALRAALAVVLMALLVVGPAQTTRTVAASGLPSGSGTSAAGRGADPDDETRTRGSSSSVGGPLIVVMDLSSSMAEADGNGVIKLEGAKTALAGVLRSQPANSEVGLWSYPSPGDSCSPGGWVGGESPRRRQDPSTLIAQVRELTSEGETPTAQALQAVGESFRDQGQATVLLVSDGQSNCGGVPCDTAKQLRAEGIDITVQAMGFQISEAGRRELQCIADATNGEYYDVENSPELAERIAELATPSLELEVSAPSTAPSGSSVDLTVVVHNPSQRLVKDVNVSLVFGDPASQSLFVAVVPPRLSLGNLPAEGRRSRTWTLSTTGGAGGVARWTVSAWSTDVGVARQQGSFTVTDTPFGLADAGPILDGLLDRGPVVVLGDSYSSGEGTGEYLTLPAADPSLTDDQSLCHRSTLSYGVTVFSDESTDLIACSGAVAVDLANPQKDRGEIPSQISQLKALPEAPSAVLLTLGGNDIGFSHIVQRCFFGRVIASIPLPDGDDCRDDEGFLKEVDRNVANVRWTLEKAYREIDAAVNSPEMLSKRDGWVAPIIVLPYTQALPDSRRSNCGLKVDDAVQMILFNGILKRLGVPYTAGMPGFTTGEIRWANSLVDRLDRQVEGAVADAVDDGLEIYFADPVQDMALPSHTSCDDDPYIVPVTSFAPYVLGVKDKLDAFRNQNQGLLNEFVHPNRSGHASMASGLVAWSRDAEKRTRADLEPQEPAIAEPSDPVTTIVLDGAGSAEVTVRAGEAVTVRVTGMEPGSFVWISIHSAPRQLGSLTAGEDGTAEGVVYVPADLPSGLHSVKARGFGADGAFLTRADPLQVYPQRPAWFWPSVALAASGVAALAALGVIALRSARRTASSGRSTP